MTDRLADHVAAQLAGRPAPAGCRSMAEVRTGVDAVDRALVLILAERQRYMEAAAALKPTREQVRDEPRIEQIIANVKAFAAEERLSEAIAEPVWRELIERCIAHEYQAFDRVRGG